MNLLANSNIDGVDVIMAEDFGDLIFINGTRL